MVFLEVVFVSGVRRAAGIFASQTRRFSAAILGGLQRKATQYASKKAARAVCNACENDFFYSIRSKISSLRSMPPSLSAGPRER